MMLNNNFSTVNLSLIHVFEVMTEKQDFMCLLWNDWALFIQKRRFF